MRRGRDFGPERAGRSGTVVVGLLRPAQTRSVFWCLPQPGRRFIPAGTREMAAHPSPEPSPRCPVGIPRRRGGCNLPWAGRGLHKPELMFGMSGLEMNGGSAFRTAPSPALPTKGEGAVSLAWHDRARAAEPHPPPLWGGLGRGPCKMRCVWPPPCFAWSPPPLLRERIPDFELRPPAASAAAGRTGSRLRAPPPLRSCPPERRRRAGSRDSARRCRAACRGWSSPSVPWRQP
jgi:hypothetical protein